MTFSQDSQKRHPQASGHYSPVPNLHQYLLLERHLHGGDPPVEPDARRDLQPCDAQQRHPANPLHGYQ